MESERLAAGATGAKPNGRADGVEGSNGQLFAKFYSDVRALAGYHLSRERDDHTLQATDLVHEAYLRLQPQGGQDDEHRTRFLSVASEMIRRILVDYARRRNTTKRGGDWKRLPMAQVQFDDFGEAAVDIVDFDTVLSELGHLSHRQARVVELRFFGGLSVAETAEALGVSAGTVKGDWRVARAWLRVRLARST